MNFKSLELLLWMAVPSVITFSLFILSVIPNHILGMSYIMPVFPLFSIFYWGKIQSAEMPYWVAFLTGLLVDVVTGTPLGMSALLYLVFLVITHGQSKYIHKEGFIIIWGYFMILLAILAISEWLLVSISGKQMQPIMAVIVQWGITVGFYPLFHKMFDNIAEHTKHRRWILTHA